MSFMYVHADKKSLFIQLIKARDNKYMSHVLRGQIVIPFNVQLVVHSVHVYSSFIVSSPDR